MDFVKLDDIKNLIPDRIKTSHKGTYGRAALLGGATEYSGAIRLAAYALSALRSGCGLSTIACPRFLVDIISKNILEQMIYPIEDNGREIIFDKENIDGLLEKVDVLAIGMGLGRSDGAKEIVRYVVENFDKKLLLDADAINIISEDVKLLDKSIAKIVLTPHMMEFTRLINGDGNKLTIEEVEKDKISLATTFAKSHKVVVVLKGSITTIVDGNFAGHIYHVDRGTPGMSTAGSGDVLSGILAGFLGYIENVADASVVAAYVNGMAGELAAEKVGEISMLASDTVNEISTVIKMIKE